MHFSGNHNAEILLASALLSLCGEIFIISFFTLKTTKSFKKLNWPVFCLTCSDFITSLAIVVFSFIGNYAIRPEGYEPNKYLCMIEGSSYQFSFLSTLLWTCFIAIHMLQKCYEIEFKYTSILFHIFGWGFPLAEVILFSIYDLWGVDPRLKLNVCWIAAHPISILISSAEIIIGVIFGLISSIIVIKKTSSFSSQIKEGQSEKIFIQIMSLYPIALAIVWLGLFVNRTLEAQGIFYEGFSHWEVAAIPLQGFFNSMIFGLALYISSEHLKRENIINQDISVPGPDGERIYLLRKQLI